MDGVRSAWGGLQNSFVLKKRGSTVQDPNQTVMVPEAEAYFSEALTLAERARAERVQGNTAQSIELAKQALELVGLTDESAYVDVIESRCRNPMDVDMLLDIMVKSLSYDDPVVRNTLERLGQRWGSWLSDYFGYLGSIYRLMIELRIAQIGPQQPEIADRLFNYGDFLDTQNFRDEAQNCLTRATAIRKAFLGSSLSANVSYAQAAAKLGCLLMSMHNHDLAETHLKTALGVLDKQQSHSLLALHILEDLANLYSETNRHSESEAVLKRALSMASYLRSPSVLNHVIQLGCIYLYWGKLHDAIAMFDYSSQVDRDPSWPMPQLDSTQTINNELSATNNPYLEIFESMDKRYGESDSRRFCRDLMVRKYSWAVPNENALKTISEYGPVVEIGAGGGYWSALLRKRGVDVIAYDALPSESGRNSYTYKAESWTEVLSGTESTAAYHPDRALMLCWPPDKDEMAWRALRVYTGNTLIYIGEEPPACTADERFHELLKQNWKLEKRIDIPQWYLINDSLFVYTRVA